MFKHVSQSQTLLLNEQSRQRQQEGQEVFKLGFGQSPFLPPLNVRKSLQQSSLRKDYAPVRGLPDLCQAAAVFHSHYHHLDIDASQILISPGSKIAIYNTLLAFDQADVLIPAPSWVSYAPQAALCGHQIHYVPTSYEDRWRVTAESLEQILQECNAPNILLILNYPGNPDGLTYDPEELKALIDIFRKYGVWVISDEIYGLLHHQGKHHSLAEFYPERTFVTTGLSKWCGAGGWRLGVEILPAELSQEGVQSLIGIASETYSCAPTPVQIAAIEAYQIDPAIDQYLSRQRHILQVLGNKITDQLTTANIRVHAPEGGFYLLIDFTAIKAALQRLDIHSDIALCQRLMQETGVALLPGSAFGMQPEQLAARLAYVDFDGEPLMQATDTPNQQEIQDHCALMFRGITALCQWVNNL